MKSRDVFLSWDFAVSLAVAAGICFWLPNMISNAFAKDLYAIGISVLSIVFSVFFAALAIIISAGDNDFISFLQKGNLYSSLIQFFRFTLFLLLLSLCGSIAIYAFTSNSLDLKIITQPKWYFVIFTFFFVYSLAATCGSVGDALRYAERRVQYIERTNAKEKFVGTKHEADSGHDNT